MLENGARLVGGDRALVGSGELALQRPFSTSTQSGSPSAFFPGAFMRTLLAFLNGEPGTGRYVPFVGSYHRA